MNILNNIRYGLAVTTLTLAYICVVIGSTLMHLTDFIAGTDFEHAPLKSWWEMYKTELELIKVSLL